MEPPLERVVRFGPRRRGLEGAAIPTRAKKKGAAVAAPFFDERSRGLKLRVNRLDLRVQIDRVLAKFAAEPRLLVTAERRHRIDHPVAVDPHRPRLERARNLVSAADVPGPDGGGQAVGS